jgi:hypothetical protein
VFNQTVCALRFYYNTTLGRNEMTEHIPYPRHQKRFPPSSARPRSPLSWRPYPISNTAPC